MTQTSKDNPIIRFFKDKDGKVVIWQMPNIPLIGWAIFEVLSLVIHSHNLKHWFSNLSMAFLFTWAYLEITKGASYFRRLLGIVIIIGLIVSYYKLA